MNSHPKPVPVLLFALVFSASCSTGQTSEPAGSSEALVSSPSASVTVLSEPSAGGPLSEHRPTLNIVGEQGELAELAMAEVVWDGLRSDPIEPDRSVALVTHVGAEARLDSEYPASLGNLSTARQAKDLRFRFNHDVALVDTTLSFAAVEPGLYLIEVDAQFLESADYSGSGTFRYATWVQVTTDNAPCARGGPKLATLSGVTDEAGCPVAPGEAMLNFESLTSDYHCAPGPAMLRIPASQIDGGVVFLREQFELGKVQLVELPADAVDTGMRLSSGAIHTSASDTEAIFVRLADGTVERWPQGPDNIGCA